MIVHFGAIDATTRAMTPGSVMRQRR